MLSLDIIIDIDIINYIWLIIQTNKWTIFEYKSVNQQNPTPRIQLSVRPFVRLSVRPHF